MKINTGLESHKKVETRGRKSLGDTKFIHTRVPGVLRDAIDRDAERRGVHYSVILREILESKYKKAGA